MKITEKPAVAEKKHALFESSIILAAVSACVYYCHYLYLFTYYREFGVPLVDLHYTLQDILIFNPWVVVFMFVVALLFIFHATGESFHFDRTSKVQLLVGCVLLGILLIGTCVSFAALGQGDARTLITHPRQVTIAFEDRTIKGYSYLTRNEDSYYFFRVPNPKYMPELLVLRAEQVKEIVTGDTLP